MIIRRNMIRTSLLLTFATLTFVACDDQNFDWDKARYNASDAYEKAFSELYGNIDSNQSWDFSYGAVAATTRAGETVTTEGINGLEFTFANKNQGNTSYQEVSNDNSANYQLYTSVSSALTEGASKTGTSSVLATPANVFSIMPITAQGLYLYDLYVKIGDQAPVRIFTKNWDYYAHVTTHGMTISSSNAYQISHAQCSTCGGDGMVAGTCTYCSGTGSAACSTCGGTGTEKVYTKQATCDNIYFKISCPMSNWTSYMSGYNTGNPSNADNYTFITFNGNTYLYNASQGYYLTLTPNGNNPYTGSTTEINSASVAYFDSSNHLIINGYYVCNNNGSLSFSSSLQIYVRTYENDVKKAYENGYYVYKNGAYYAIKKSGSTYYYGNSTSNKINNNDGFYELTTVTEWTKTTVSPTTNNTTKVASALDAASPYTTKTCSTCNGSRTVTCPVCNGNPTSCNTACSACNGTGETYTVGDKYSSNITTNMPGIKINSNQSTAGLSVQLFIRILKGDNDSPAGTVIGSTTGNTYYVTPDGKKVLSTLSDGSYTVKLSDILCDDSEFLYVGFEDKKLANSSSTGDFNDLTLAIFGLGSAPTHVPVSNSSYTSTYTVSKRYMVEDMGFGSITGYNSATGNSTAVNNNYTDIDFNDIVVDFEQNRTTLHKLTITNGLITAESETGTGNTTTAKIYALGGTWDFKLKIGDTPIFQKSLAEEGSTTYPVTFNEDYKIPTISNGVVGDKSGSGETISKLWPNIIYNTNPTASTVYDGNFSYSTYIAEISSESVSALNNWNPTTNNISFELIDSDAEAYGVANSMSSKNGGSDTAPSNNVYYMSFPEVGETPKIVAFPITKNWQREKVHVTKKWFGNDTYSVNGSDQLIKYDASGNEVVVE